LNTNINKIEHGLNRAYCIYILQNKFNNKIYVGQSHNVQKRLWGHKSSMKCGNQYPLYKSMRKHGFDNFSVIIVEEHLSLDDANYWEDFYIQFFQSRNKQFGYNLRDGGQNTIFPPEVNKKRADKIRGRKHTIEAKEKMSAAKRGKKCSEETKLKLSVANKGKKKQKLTDDHKEKLRNANVGKKASEETKTKMSQAQSGDKNHRYGKKLTKEESEYRRKMLLGDNYIEITQSIKEKILYEYNFCSMLKGELRKKYHITSKVLNKIINE
jgi:group I intron endonuclease